MHLMLSTNELYYIDVFTWESLTKLENAYLKLSNYMAVSKQCYITALAPFDSLFTSISSS